MSTPRVRDHGRYEHEGVRATKNRHAVVLQVVDEYVIVIWATTSPTRLGRVAAVTAEPNDRLWRNLGLTARSHFFADNLAAVPVDSGLFRTTGKRCGPGAFAQLQGVTEAELAKLIARVREETA